MLTQAVLPVGFVGARPLALVRDLEVGTSSVVAREVVATRMRRLANRLGRKSVAIGPVAGPSLPLRQTGGDTLTTQIRLDGFVNGN